MTKNLFYKKENAWKGYSEKEKKVVMNYAEQYKAFLQICRTERITVQYMKNESKKHSFGKGKKFVINNSNKAVALVSLGTISPLKGIKFVGSHIDVPRIDVKQNPLYEKFDLAQLKTHYYGGIKKYQWFNRPLGIFGVILTRTGKKIEVRIGEKDSDPVFVISDLLPHLSKDQGGKTVSKAFDGEKLNVIFGSIPLSGKEKDSIKANILNILNKKYGIIEEDFISAELEVVPIDKVRDIGMDRGLIGGYGHDDRVCSYASATALFDSKNKYTAVSVMFDKEETGSDGKTGANGRFIEDVIIEILEKSNIKPTFANVRKVMNNSEMLSADVSCGVNPDYPEVHDIKNAAIIGNGIAIVKFAGSRGKAGTNDANAEFVNKIRNIFNKSGVVWQSAELGKVDQGGGGTIAKFMAQHGIDVLDCGPALLGMHSPFEIVSKADLYETYKAYREFFISM